MRQTRKSSLFLMELIIAILFFSLSAAVCVRLFAASYTTSMQSTYRDTASLQAQSMAALFQNEQGDMAQLLCYANASPDATATGQYRGTITEGGTEYAIYLTTEVMGSDGVALPAAPETATAGQCAQLTIAITPAQETEAIITLQSTVYLPLQIQEGA